MLSSPPHKSGKMPMEINEMIVGIYLENMVTVSMIKKKR
jgi:hypothetical protein